MILYSIQWQASHGNWSCYANKPTMQIIKNLHSMTCCYGYYNYIHKSEDEEISNFKENAVPKSTKVATKFGLKLFRGRKQHCRILLNFISHIKKHCFI
jgi:hypothetical protein